MFTPREVIKLLVPAEPRTVMSLTVLNLVVGNILIITYKHVEDKHGREEADKLLLYEQRKTQISRTGQDELVTYATLAVSLVPLTSISSNLKK